jgi:hypothetical protein
MTQSPEITRQAVLKTKVEELIDNGCENIFATNTEMGVYGPDEITDYPEALAGFGFSDEAYALYLLTKDKIIREDGEVLSSGEIDTLLRKFEIYYSLAMATQEDADTADSV